MLTQQPLFDRTQLLADLIRDKLVATGSDHFARGFMNCHTESKVLVCSSCHDGRIVYNTCSCRWCPWCAQRNAAARRDELAAFLPFLREPKHLVLTARNQTSLRKMFTVVLAGWNKLKRRDVLAKMRGGWLSIEVTNECRGWHVHAHALVDMPYVDVRLLAREWGQCVGQNFAIVKLKDARERSYLQEVSKYTVKPSSMAGWNKEDVAEFVRAVRRRRLFKAFGNVAKMRKENSFKTRRLCKCGACEWRIEPHVTPDAPNHRTVPEPQPALLPPPSNYDAGQ